MDDTKHEYVHAVLSWPMWHDFEAGKRNTVTSVCGKTWTPVMPMNLKKPKCPECFPPRPKWEISA